MTDRDGTLFWSKTDQTGGPDACWPWTGAKNKYGYGIVNRDRRMMGAHRWAFILTNGKPDDYYEPRRGSQGTVIRHLCHNRLCCNPKHLAAGTQQDNVDDLWSRVEMKTWRETDIEGAKPAVFEAVEAVQTALAKQGIAKEGKNAAQGFKFRGIDQVLGTLSGLLAANRLVLTMNQTDLRTEVRETKSGGKMYVTIVTARFIATSLVDGSTLDMGTYSGEGADSGDKATSKSLSMCMKYAAFLGFCIPLEGVLDDADADSPSEAPAASKKPSKASKVEEPQDDADEAPEAAQEPEPAKKKPGRPKKEAAVKSEIDTALESIAACEDLEAAEKLAMSLRGLRAHERFGEIKTAMTAKLKELKKD